MDELFKNEIYKVVIESSFDWTLFEMSWAMTLHHDDGLRYFMGDIVEFSHQSNVVIEDHTGGHLTQFDSIICH